MNRLLFAFLSFILFFSLTVTIVHAQAEEWEDFSRVCEEDDSVDQCAIQKLNYGMQPDQQIEQVKDDSVFSWLTSIGQTLDELVAYFTGAENLKEAYIPDLEEEAQKNTGAAQDSDTKEENTELLNNTLAGPEGYYGMTLPAELPDDYAKPAGKGIDINGQKIPLFSDIDAEGMFYEQSSFPEEFCDEKGNCTKVCPVTGQCNE
jgi:hypothetical protein